MNLLRCSYLFIDKFFAVSKSMIPILTNMGVSNDKLHLIHNPIQIRKSTASRTSIRQKYSITKKYVITFAGRLTIDKGIDKLIHMIQYLKNTELIIVGHKRGDYLNLRKLAIKLGIAKKVRFLGFLKHEELQKIYEITDLVVLPETFYEPLSRLLLEASANGIPCIASNIGGNKEIIEHNQTGYLLTNETQEEIIDLINYYFENPLVRKEQGKKAQQKVEAEFNLKIIGHKLSKEYFLLLKRA